MSLIILIICCLKWVKDIFEINSTNISSGLLVILTTWQVDKIFGIVMIFICSLVSIIKVAIHIMYAE